MMDIDDAILEIEMLAARRPLTLEEKFRLIDMFQGLTAGGPSMCDRLLEDRRLERERELAEEGW
jgi:hypothetical protein